MQHHPLTMQESDPNGHIRRMKLGRNFIGHEGLEVGGWLVGGLVDHSLGLSYVSHVGNLVFVHSTHTSSLSTKKYFFYETGPISF